jgi:hypothetical protein
MRKFLAGIAALCVLGAFSCGGDEKGKGTVSITNATTVTTFNSAYLSPTSESTWGTNQLSEPLAPGETEIWIDVPEDDYDFIISIALPGDNPEAVTNRWVTDMPLGDGDTRVITLTDLGGTWAVSKKSGVSGPENVESKCYVKYTKLIGGPAKAKFK